MKKTPAKKKGNYNEGTVVSQLTKNKHIEITGLTIKIDDRHAREIGIGTKGKLDFLVQHCGYRVSKGQSYQGGIQVRYLTKVSDLILLTNKATK